MTYGYIHAKGEPGRRIRALSQVALFHCLPADRQQRVEARSKELISEEQASRSLQTLDGFLNTFSAQERAEIDAETKELIVEVEASMASKERRPKRR